MSHQPNLAYRVVELSPYGGTASAKINPDGALRVLTACSQCGSNVDSVFRTGYPGGRKGLGSPTPGGTQVGVPTTVTIICACGYPHAGRPIDSIEQGCGAFWTVEVVPT